MKILFQVMAGLLVVGVVLGVVVSNATTKPLVPLGQEEAAMKAIAAAKEAEVRRREAARQPSPKAKCAEPSFHFGLMDPLTVGEHTFVIENAGETPLLLAGGKSSCKCTLSDLAQAEVAPGEAYEVTLRWNSGHASREFNQSATVITNDPQRPELQLRVSGEVRAVLAALPTSLPLGRLIPEEESRFQFAVYSQVWESMEIVEVKCSNEHFTGRVSPTGFEKSYAFDDEIRNATSTVAIDLLYDGQAPRGPISGVIQFRVKPPADWQRTSPALGSEEAQIPSDASTPASEKSAPADGRADDGAAQAAELGPAAGVAAEGLPEISFPTQEDGTIVGTLKFQGDVVRRLSLYGKPVQGDGTIDLGNVPGKQSAGNQWFILGRIRGSAKPSTVDVALDGIPGVTASVEEIEVKGADYSFRVQIDMPEEMKPAIYDRAQAGTLTVRAPGMPPGDDLLELPVHLSVLP